ncbi:Uncharacterized protein BP5553_01892 [Venustampulla echinocandica]|uniref:Uncharacterized protein n=1 Tax=Venustampulla echinocandica TaxID=2656787 RepID=A0A370U2E8_9HELO|nr:Uncharacterized protein BP5553_01892 [Venustampulla echinocandica]RDL41913.1 Uncharacterized protein BP5553_01892 [Venustampulla echinocandica]
MALPGSPTLTNPDMILPYGEYESAPSPSSQHPYRPPSPGNNWIDPADLQFSLGPPRMGSITPTTPIIYGNGTMLSDIGEVTEAESTPKRRLPGPAERRMLKQAQSFNLPIKSSPTMGYQVGMKRAKSGTHLRKFSMESTSTVTSEPPSAEIFKDFDDGISVDDSNFQGDDEESVADSYSEELVAQETRRLSRRESIITLDDDQNGSAALSRRAEEILSNAKKRLTNMEGNLTRARSSLFITPSKSISSIHSSSPLTRPTPSPPPNERLIGPLGTAPSRHRQLHTGSGATSASPGHSRIYSENSISSPLRGERFPVRAASAAARYVGKGGTDGNQRTQSASPSSEDTHEGSTTPSRLSYSSPSTRASPPHAATLEPLNEDQTAPEFDFDRASVRSSINGSFVGPDGERVLARSTSSMQMRDLQSQMHGLKGRLSVLRDRARDDTMKRRSLQSLRTPSPFTAAEEWYTAAKAYGEEPLSADAGVVHPPWNEEEVDGDKEDKSSAKLETVDQEDFQEVVEYADSDVTSVYEDVAEDHPVTSILPPADEPGTPVVDSTQSLENDASHIIDNDDDRTQSLENDGHHVIDNEDDYDDELINHDEIDDCESDASLYHDSYDTMISHEDREDAFDYEHFFLHSAMGTISQQVHNRRDSVSTVGSEDSVETTRAPIAQSTDNTKSHSRQSWGHERSGSSISTSTMQTFATAAEEQDDEDTFGNDEFAVQQVDAPTRRGSTPLTTKRETFGGTPFDLVLPDSDEFSSEDKSRPSSVFYEAQQQNGTSDHRLSVSSVGSTRSFPLVNKPKSSSSGPASVRESGGSNLSSDTPTLVDRQSTISDERLRTSPVHMLAKEDQILVERLVASLGKCVLGLQEAGRGNHDGRMWRRRLDAARRVLEGQQDAI